MKNVVMAVLVAVGLAWLLLAAVAQGQPVADLGVEVSISPADLYTPPGSTGVLTFTLTNYGPDPAGSITTGSYPLSIFSNSFPWSKEYGEPVIFRKVPGSPCLLFWGNPKPPPGGSFVIGYAMELPPLQPGESTVCELTYLVNPLAPDVEVFSSWTTFSPNDFDPAPTNDQVSHTYLIRVPAIPTLDLPGITLLIFALGLFGMLTLLSRRNQP